MWKYISLSLTLLFLISACAKPGKGGSATLSVNMLHHGTPILSKITWPDTVFVKFGTKSLPGTDASDFDTWYVGTQGSSIVQCTELRWGNYYLYGVGYDSSCLCRVTGGLAVKIPRGDREDNIDMELYLKE